MLLTSSQANPHGFCAKISDFGLARNLDLVSRVETKTTGTVTHMPPEVLSDGIISKARYEPLPLINFRPAAMCCMLWKTVIVSLMEGLPRISEPPLDLDMALRSLISLATVLCIVNVCLR